MASLQDNFKDIVDRVSSGNGVLFLGAGATMEAGGPSSAALVKSIREKFPKADRREEFIEQCQDVLDTPPYDRNQLEDFIRKELRALQPSDAHRELTKYPWAALLTTNYDDLVELAYRTVPPYKVCQPIFADTFQVNVADRNRVYLFKLMGSVGALQDDSGQMVLSRADYNKALIRRHKYFELLTDFAKGGGLIFVGYSFHDRIMFDVLDELIDIVGIERLPYSYALFDSVPDDPKVLANYTRRRIIPVRLGFGAFLRTLAQSRGTSPNPNERKPEDLKLTLRSLQLRLTPTLVRSALPDFELLTEESLNKPAGLKDDFFKGTNTSSGAFRQGWDMPRDIYSDPGFQRRVGATAIPGSFRDRVFAELRKTEIPHNRVLLLTGMAGIGKSVMLRRLAYDVASSGESPVILVRPDKVTLDYKVLTTLIEDLNSEFDRISSTKQPALKPLIILDDAAGHIRHVNRIREYLTSRGRPALVVAGARVNEWEVMWDQFKFELPSADIYEIPPTLTPKETGRLTKHFYDLGYLPDASQYWQEKVSQDLDHSFFAAVYTLVHPSRKPLSDILKDQYQSLSPLTQNAFSHVCVFHQFGLPINLELLVRTLKCSYNRFMEEVVGKDAARVLFDEADLRGNILYSSQHRIIAQRTIELFFPDPKQQEQLLIDILGSALLSNRREREIVEKLMVGYVGPNAKQQVFTPNQQRKMFETICATNPTRTLLHHWGILEVDIGEFPHGEVLLKRALEFPHEESDAFRGESDQNILTSLGALHSRLGLECEAKTGGGVEAKRHFEDATRFFSEAKFGAFPNSYAYHAQANMWLSRALATPDLVQRADRLGTALEILAVAKDNLNETDQEVILGLEARVLFEIGREPDFETILATLRDKYNSAKGYYIYAELRWRVADKRGTLENQRGVLTAALARLKDEALKRFPNDEGCLRLQAKLMKRLISSQTLSDYYTALQRWKAVVSTPNVSLLYELGRIAFELGYYDAARTHFSDLETGVGAGHQLRSRPREPIAGKNGRSQDFRGTILRVDDPGNGVIRCDSLPDLRYPLPFRPIAVGFFPSVGDVVSHQIEFSFRGPIAVRVTKL